MNKIFTLASLKDSSSTDLHAFGTFHTEGDAIDITSKNSIVVPFPSNDGQMAGENFVC